MKTLPLLIALLVAATLMVNLVVWVFPSEGLHTLIFPVSLAMSQVGMLAVWLGFGRRRFILRMTIVVLAMGCWAEWLRMQMGYSPWSIVVIVLVSLIMLVIFLLRWFGWVITNEEEYRQEEIAGTQGFQFELWQVLVWMTVAAVGLGLIRARTADIDNEMRLVEGLSMGLAFAPCVLMAMWLALGTQRLGRRIMLFILWPLLSIPLLKMALSDPNSSADEQFGFGVFLAICFMISVLTSLLSLSLLVFRQCGYRMVRQAPFQAPEGEEPDGLDEPAAP